MKKEEMAKAYADGFAKEYREIAYDAFLCGYNAKCSTEVPNDLEEAAKECNSNLQLQEYFIKGGIWQKEQDDIYVDTIYQQGIEKGKDDMKEQMMKEAVDADVKLTLHDKTGDISLYTGYLPKELGIKCNDKVRIIIVKE